MAEEAVQAESEATPETSSEESTPTFTQDQVNALIAKEKGKIQSKYADYGELKSAAAKLAEIEEASASELEKAQKKAAQTEKELAETRASLVRHEVIVEKEVPAKLAPLLTATDREGLEAQAELILENAKPETSGFDGGPREPTPDPKSPEEQHNESVLGLLGLGT